MTVFNEIQWRNEQFSICTVFMDLKALETLFVRSIG